MSDIKLFRFHSGQATEIEGTAVALERSLQSRMEQNLDTLLGVRFLASEYSTGKTHAGRIDTIGIDENGSPVIIEYKRSTNENVVSQGLYYLDWLLDHKGEFQLLVQERLGQEVAKSIDWNSTRLVCVAGGYTKYDEHAVKQVDRNIELLRYRRFGDDLLLLELVNSTSAGVSKPGGATPPSPDGKSPIQKALDNLQGDLRDLYEEVRSFLMGLGDDVQERPQKFYIAYKRLQNFACLEAHHTKKLIRLFLKVNPDEVDLRKGLIDDVRNVGHFGTGDLQVTLRTSKDLKAVEPLIVTSYEKS